MFYFSLFLFVFLFLKYLFFVRKLFHVYNFTLYLFYEQTDRIFIIFSLKFLELFLFLIFFCLLYFKEPFFFLCIINLIKVPEIVFLFISIFIYILMNELGIRIFPKDFFKKKNKIISLENFTVVLLFYVFLRSFQFCVLIDEK